MDKYLKEENYQKTKNMLKIVGIAIILCGLVIGGLIVYNGFKSESIYNKDKDLKLNILNKELTTLKEREKVLQEEYANNLDFSNTSKIMLELSNVKSDIMDKESEIYKLEHDFDHTSLIFKIFPAIMINILTLGIGIMVLMSAYQRNILAFQLGGIMPVAKEGMEEIAPTVGKTGSTILKEMTPAYKEVVKEVTKGIKEGLKGEEDK